MKKLMAALFALLVAFAYTANAAEEKPAPPENKQFVIKPIDDAWRASLPRDAQAATQAFMDRLPKETVERANNYFEGGYWLLLWNFLLGLAISWVLLAGQRAARFRDWCYRKGKRPFIADAIFGMERGLPSIVGGVRSSGVRHSTAANRRRWQRCVASRYARHR